MRQVALSLSVRTVAILTVLYNDADSSTRLVKSIKITVFCS
jgi:hypothetical protein